MVKNFLEQLNQFRKQAFQEIEALKNQENVESFKLKYLARKGALNQFFQKLADLGKNERKEAGQLANQIKEEIVLKYNQANQLITQHKKLEFIFDETLPGLSRNNAGIGTLHPITQFLNKIGKVFVSMGFEVVEDMEVETAEYNFDKLNISESHPARDMWDTFYIKVKSEKLKVKSGRETIIGTPLVLRTHTSPVQLRAMETRKPPVRLIVPGRVYRHEATDASHETNFYQLEGLVIDENISVANMIYVLDQVLKFLFGTKVKIRIRPSFFPFVEPGHEIDMSCIICGGHGCSVCGQSGWLEMLGAGMVHPVVLKNMKVDSQKYSGFAFGMGIDRLMMLHYGVDDVRLSYSGDLRFLKQF